MEHKFSKLSLISFVMIVLSGGGTLLVELGRDSIHDIESAMFIACLVVLVFYPCIVISFILALISIIRIVLYKQKGILFAFLTLVLSASLITWAMILESRPENPEDYAPTVTGEPENHKGGS